MTRVYAVFPADRYVRAGVNPSLVQSLLAQFDAWPLPLQVSEERRLAGLSGTDLYAEVLVDSATEAEVLAWVGSDQDRADSAYAAEAKSQARPALLAALWTLAGNPGAAPALPDSPFVRVTDRGSPGGVAGLDPTGAVVNADGVKMASVSDVTLATLGLATSSYVDTTAAGLASYVNAQTAAVAGSASSALAAGLAAKASAALVDSITPDAGARAVGKGEVVVDAADYPTVQDAVNAAGAAGRAATVQIRGTRTLAATLDVPSRVTLRGDGAARLVLSGAVAGPAIRAAGTLPATGSPTSLLSGNATAGSTTITVTTPAAVAEGDVLVIGDNVAPDPTQPTRLGGELVRVLSKTGSTLTLARPLRWGYTTAQAAALWKVSPVTGVAVENVEVSRATGMGGTANTSGLIDLFGCADAAVRSVKVTGNAGPAISIQHSWDVEIVGCTITDLADDAANGKYGYGINIGGAVDNLVVSACTFRRMRHAITTNGSAHHGQPTGLVFDGLVATECTGAAFDTHAWGAGILFDGCVAYACAQNGFTIRSVLTTLTGCKAVDCVGGGYLVAETVARDVAFLGCVAIDVGSHGFHVRDDGPARIRFIGNLVDRAGSNGIQVASGCSDILIQGNALLNCGRSATQGIGVQALPATGTGTGWAVLDNTFAATDAPAGTTGGYRQAILLAATVSGHATDNKAWNTRTNLAAFGGMDNVRQRDNVRLDLGAAVVDGTAAPTTGTWMRGDVIRNTAPAASGFMGWVCTTAGGPGDMQWKTFGPISA